MWKIVRLIFGIIARGLRSKKLEDKAYALAIVSGIGIAICFILGLILLFVGMPLSLLINRGTEQFIESAYVVLLWILLSNVAVFVCMLIVAGSKTKESEDLRKRTLHTFLTEWERGYQENARQLLLFSGPLAAEWTDGQKQKFIRLFYHTRGHFHEFLWVLANRATTPELRALVIKNMRDELGAKYGTQPHEELFTKFADTFGVDVDDEARNGTSYLRFLRAFNQRHLDWLYTHSSDSNWALFCAYELLDNADYTNLLKLATAMGTLPEGLTFFTVHVGSGHYREASEPLSRIWTKNPDVVREAVAFIAEHQLAMWRALGEEVTK